MEIPKAIILDIDGTLSPSLSWTALTLGLGASVDEHMSIFQAHKNGETTFEQSRDELLRLWQDTGNANKSFFKDLFEAIPLSDGAEKVVEQLRGQSKLCLITGSMDLYAEVIARKLHIVDYFANSLLRWDEKGNLISFEYTLNQSKVKLEQLLGYCIANNLKPEDCVAVGDSDNDIGLFEATGHGIAIGEIVPKELRAVAWKTISSISQLPGLLNQ